MKKIITAVLAVTMAVGMLTGCGSGSGTGKKEASGEKLVIWTNMNVEVDTIQKYADEWGEKNGRKVEVIHQSPSVQQFAQAVKSASGPDAVVGIPNDQLADYVNADLTAEVPQDLYADQDFSDAAIQACYVDGKRYAAPLSVETTALFYNTDLVSEVPKTWEELVDQAAADGGVQFDATSIYYDLGFVRACGTILVDGREQKDLMQDVGFIIERPEYIPYYSAKKNLEIIAAYRKVADDQRICTVLEMFGLDPSDKKAVGKYSLGMKQKLALSMAFLEDPKVLILDEPLSALDADSVQEARKRILEEKERGKLVLIASHYPEDIQSLCDEVYWMKNGHVLPSKENK